ncbi:MAG TPA: hypothetical protein VMV15_03935 [Candidatus Binataceae bacterium]|nr:hypothetical protein [Candidatus Binataceae bacterium]
MKAKGMMVTAVVSLVLIVSGSAYARQCFSLFNGTVTLEVNSSVKATGPLNGREFGTGLASCAGLSAWPIIGSAFRSASGDIVLAWRAMTVDTSSCGAVDFIVDLSGKPLSGTALLHNDRSDFSNSTTMTKVACPRPLPSAREFESAPAQGLDLQGNGQ